MVRRDFLREAAQRSDPAKLSMAVVLYDTEAHAVPGRMVDGKFLTYEHFMVDGKWVRDCPCEPVVNWYSDAYPLPLYEHLAPKNRRDA